MQVRSIDDRLDCRLVDVAESGRANDEDSGRCRCSSDVPDRQRRQSVADRTKALGVSGVNPVEEAEVALRGRRQVRAPTRWQDRAAQGVSAPSECSLDRSASTAAAGVVVMLITTFACRRAAARALMASGPGAGAVLEHDLERRVPWSPWGRGSWLRARVGQQRRALQRAALQPPSLLQVVGDERVHVRDRRGAVGHGADVDAPLDEVGTGAVATLLGLVGWTKDVAEDPLRVDDPYGAVGRRAGALVVYLGEVRVSGRTGADVVVLMVLVWSWVDGPGQDRMAVADGDQAVQFGASLLGVRGGLLRQPQLALQV